MDCYLMPSPGKKVILMTEDYKFTGALQDIDGDFVEHIPKLADCLLHPKNLVVKKPGDANALLCYLIECWKAIESGRVPDVKSATLYLSIATALQAKESGERSYKDEMEKKTGRKFVKWEILSTMSNETKNIVLKNYEEQILFIDSEMKETYKREFLKSLDEIEEGFKKENSYFVKISEELKTIREEAIKNYKETMEKKVDGDYIKKDELDKLHDELTGTLISKCEKFKDSYLHKSYVKTIKRDFEEMYAVIGEKNDKNKNSRRIKTATGVLGAIGGGLGLGLTTDSLIVLAAGTLSTAGAGVLVGGLVVWAIKDRINKHIKTMHKKLSEQPVKEE